MATVRVFYTNTATGSLSDEYGRLCQQLSAAAAVGTTSNKFSVEAKNNAPVEFLLQLQDEYKILPAAPSFVRKSAVVSGNYRSDGNGKFKDKKLQDAVELYTKCIAHAPNNTESLGLGYANRSAVLFELEMYQDCLADIRSAKNSNYPKDLSPKLTERMKKALLAVKTKLKSNVVDPKDTKGDKSKISAVSLINAESNPDPPTIPSTLLNSKISSAASNVAIRYTVTNGRFVVAVKDIQIGDIIAVEKPYAKLVLSDVSEVHLLHCHSCLRVCYSLQPCRGCTHALYCSKVCRDDAWRAYHKYECPIIDALLQLQLNKLYHLALRVTIQARREYAAAAEYPKRRDVYESDRYEEIHKLIPNTKSRTNADLFERAFNAAYLYQLVKNHTSFFTDNKTTEKKFQNLLFHHLQTGPCNFHEISEIQRTKDGCNLVEIGAGAYSFLSIFNHSCHPNVVRHCYKNTIVVRAIAKIAKGQQVSDNYGYHHALTTKESRQKSLKSQYFFDCNCEACNKKFPLYQELPEKSFVMELSEDEMNALRTGNITIEALQETIRHLQIKIAVLEKMKPCKNLSNMQECLKQCFALMGNKRIL